MLNINTTQVKQVIGPHRENNHENWNMERKEDDLEFDEENLQTIDNLQENHRKLYPKKKLYQEHYQAA